MNVCSMKLLNQYGPLTSLDDDLFPLVKIIKKNYIIITKSTVILVCHLFALVFANS